MMKKYGVFIVTLLLFLGCKKHPDKTSLYFGGEIINPKSNVVLLMQHDKVIDSLIINENNLFGKRIYNVSEGLYYFKHGYEFQYIYLEPKDSIQIRLNTWDFDETLAFDGKGADKNELLIELFLANEKETQNFYTYFSLDENAFQEKIETLFSRHNAILEDFITTHNNISDKFLHLAQGIINYGIYRFKEQFPYYHNKSLKEKLYKPSDSFYSFREEKINLNDSILSEYYTYQNYISTYLYNEAYRKNNYNKFDSNFRSILLQEIVDKIQLQSIKNRLLFQEIDYMLFSDDYKIDSLKLAVFYNNSTDSIAINDIKQILKAKEDLPNNTPFPNFEIFTKDGETTDIQSLIKGKKSVLYFCSDKESDTNYLKKRINFLLKKYPTIQFIGINPTANSVQINTNCYYLTNNSTGKSFVSKKHSRAIIIDDKGIVMNNYTLLSAYQIEKQLQKLLDSTAKP